jgi:hypothetical protein
MCQRLKSANQGMSAEKKKIEMQKTWLCAAKLQFGLAHRTVRWCTGQCPVRQAGPRELAALRIRRRRMTKIYRIVRWCTGLSGESSAANLPLLGNGKGDVAITHRTIRWCTGLSGEPTVTCANGRPRNLHVTRCPVRQSTQRSNGRICQIWKEIVHRTVYRTCPVAHRSVRCGTR